MVTTASPIKGIETIILEGLNTAVLVFDNQLQLVYINPTGEMLYQSSAKRLHGNSLEQLLPVENANLAKAARAALETGHPFTEHGITFSLPFQKALEMDCAITPLADSKHPPLLMMEFNRVDQSLRVNREEQQLNQNLALRDVLRGLAHEIKNPLGGLRGAAQLLERELPNEALKEYTGIIIGEADRLRNLVNRLLAPNTLPKQQSVNIHEVLEHVRQLLSADAPQGLKISSDYDPSLPELTADRDQLIQAVLNIVANAVQATEGQADAHVSLKTRAERQCYIGHERHRLVCHIDVIDNGPGIDPQMQERIFFPMVTGRADGTGLGLPIAQSLIQQHHGIIQCQSKPGETQFSILLPMDTIPPEKTEQS